MSLKSDLKFPVFLVASLLILLVASVVLRRDNHGEYGGQAEITLQEPRDTVIDKDVFGIPRDVYRIENGVVEARQTLSHIFSRLGFNQADTDRVAREMKDVFNPRRIRRGNNYYAYYAMDGSAALSFFIYEISDLEFVRIDFRDSIRVLRSQKQVSVIPGATSGIISSSLWNTLMDNDLHPELVMHMSRILAWSVDFYRIYPGDRFKVLYSEQYVGDRPVGVSHVDAVYFLHRGREIEGYRFEADTIKGYFDPDGNNLRKFFLRAPLEFVRISSRYSHSRLHPVHGDRRPHLGTDYAAPHGTPILAVGDGEVTRASYTRGNGNYVRIRHNSVYETQYLHMSRFASGIRPGVSVSQGDVIGYVGSTGIATGPHVCFRFWKNGRQVDHLRLEFPSGDPLPEEYMDAFVRRKELLKSKLDNIVFEEEPAI